MCVSGLSQESVPGLTTNGSSRALLHHVALSEKSADMKGFRNEFSSRSKAIERLFELLFGADSRPIRLDSQGVAAG